MELINSNYYPADKVVSALITLEESRNPQYAPHWIILLVCYRDAVVPPTTTPPPPEPEKPINNMGIVLLVTIPVIALLIVTIWVLVRRGRPVTATIPAAKTHAHPVNQSVTVYASQENKSVFNNISAWDIKQARDHTQPSPRSVMQRPGNQASRNVVPSAVPVFGAASQQQQQTQRRNDIPSAIPVFGGIRQQQTQQQQPQRTNPPPPPPYAPLAIPSTPPLPPEDGKQPVSPHNNLHPLRNPGQYLSMFQMPWLQQHSSEQGRNRNNEELSAVVVNQQHGYNFTGRVNTSRARSASPTPTTMMMMDPLFASAGLHLSEEKRNGGNNRKALSYYPGDKLL